MIGIEDCLSEVMSIPGALDAVLVEPVSGMAVMGSGLPDPARSAAGLTETFRAALEGIALASPEGTVRIDNMIITTETSHHLIKTIEMVFDGPLLICLRLDLERSNLALAQWRLGTITDQLMAH
ncbi:hypothetical protein GCM10023194_60860 [Planotetraspora phitsanulokensis]|uniref:Roadblock/LC7 domain-containing protein n=1 Tax=Planotetraspora phitsanulokensis TaxID=575192 RepID=A0A8J3U345_9ACTN|nr:roadblock/LC7 domain-containing protein [Planotetraspora phitsanulokensis]GII37693.1 hypothetical protein Pph01_26960 [Planotetraspora phitsanulokensis]